MIFNLGDARTFCQNAIGEGVDPASGEACDVINEATQHLLRKGHWKHSIKRMHIRTYNDVVPCPASVSAILKVNFCRTPGFVFGQWYEFMDAGPGTLLTENVNTSGMDLVDQGTFPTFFPIGDTAMTIAAFSSEVADMTETVRVRGFNANYEEVAPTTPGELLRINYWGNGTEGTINNPVNLRESSNQFVEVSSIVKPVTVGHVSLYAVNFDNVTATPIIYFLGKYGPNETQPGYRRYKISSTTSREELCVNALVKIQYVPVIYDSDPLLIQDLPALKLMCKAIHEMNHGSMDDYRNLRNEAVELLDEQLKDGQAPQLHLDVDEEMSFGSLPEIG